MELTVDRLTKQFKNKTIKCIAENAEIIYD